MHLELCGIKLNINSIGGHNTCIELPGYKIAIDMGICTSKAVRCHTVFFTHAHTDHMAGVVRHCSIREMMGMEGTTYIVGQEHRSRFDDMMNAWRRLNRSFMRCTVKTMRPGEAMKIRQDLYIEAFRSIHRMPCQGYILYQEKSKLLAKYSSLSGKEIAALKRSGNTVTEMKREPLLAYTGDTVFDVFHTEPILRRSKILIMEITFFDHRVSIESARENGHIHIDEIPGDDNFFQNEHIIIMHVSARYTTEEVRKIIKEKLPPKLLEKITLIPNDH